MWKTWDDMFVYGKPFYILTTYLYSNPGTGILFNKDKTACK